MTREYAKSVNKDDQEIRDTKNKMYSDDRETSQAEYRKFLQLPKYKVKNKSYFSRTKNYNYV